MFAVGVAGLYAWQFQGGLSGTQEVWGQFGDYLGGVLNPMLGFLTLLALLVTITLQSRELRLSTEELKKSASALQSQNDTLKRQSFESTFFQLLRLHNDIVTAMDVTAKHSSIETRGRDCFGVFVKELRGEITQAQATSNAQLAGDAYLGFYRRRQRDLGHYFRLLYHIVKFVDRSDVANKKFYTNLVRAQLSSDELKLLFFNCLSPLGNEKFKKLIERYALLKTLPEDEFPSPALRKAYLESAYAASDSDGVAIV